MKEPQPKTYFELLADFVTAARRVVSLDDVAHWD